MRRVRSIVHIMHVKAQWPPDPYETVSELAELLALIRDALAHGADEAVKYYEARRGASIDPWLYSHIVRDEARQYLLNGGVRALGFDVRDLAMSGIHLRRENIHLRVFKATYHMDRDSGTVERGIPGPRHSRQLREYFNQPPLTFNGNALLLDTEQPLKLVGLWGRDAEYQLGSFDLACPRRSNASRNCVETYWLVPADVRVRGSFVDAVLENEPIMLDDLELPDSGHQQRAAGDDQR